MVVEAKRDVPWTRPDDIPFDPEKANDLVKLHLGGSHDGGFIGGFADGSVRFVSNMVDPGVFKGLVTPTGGEVVNLPGGPIPIPMGVPASSPTSLSN
jgi:hypothetical protein